MKVRKGYEYQNTKEEIFVLPLWFPALLISSGYKSDWVRLSFDLDGWVRLVLSKGYAWDGATGFPDHNWIIVPSGIHDAMLQALAHYKQRELLTKDQQEELKTAIDKWFIELVKQRIPRWRRFTPSILFLGVNKVSKILPGSQAHTHRVREYE